MELMREESFGPIIGIQKVSRRRGGRGPDERHALRAHRRRVHADGARAQALLARVNAGSVYWNCCDRVSPRLPWSGVGRFGRGPHAVHLRHPGLHAAQGLAPAQPLKPTQLTLFDLDHTLLAGDSDVLWCDS